MRNSDKLIRLTRRKATLENAVTNDLPQEQIENRAERVRQAVLSALKKHRMQFTKYEKDAESNTTTKWVAECEALEEKWLNITSEEVVEISCQWPEHPKLKNLGVKFN
ncbi:MAG: hypothetical protein GY793_10530 [Proteobacteria bacterium]|nr:hypothetical protein [Pseudomonadota bacterium]